MKTFKKVSSANKTAIITGATRGIGKEVAKVFAKKGYNIVLISRNASNLNKVKAELEKFGNKILITQSDITKSTEVKALYNEVFEHFARINVLVNIASKGIFKPMESTTSKDWDTVMNLNVKGSFLMIKELVVHFKDNRDGTIINVLSDAARRTFKNGALYSASKYAQLALSETVRKELQPYGIRVTNIFPGITATEFADNDTENSLKKNYLRPENISRTIDYIISAPKHVIVDEVMLHPLTQLPD